MTQVALITGAAGFCARHLAQRLRRIPDLRVVGFDRQATMPLGAELDEYVQGDLKDARQVASVVRRTRPDRVFHLAGLLNGSAGELYEVNFKGGLHLLEAVRSESTRCPRTRYRIRSRIWHHCYVGNAGARGSHLLPRKSLRAPASTL